MDKAQRGKQAVRYRSSAKTLVFQQGGSVDGKLFAPHAATKPIGTGGHEQVGLTG